MALQMCSRLQLGLAAIFFCLSAPPGAAEEVASGRDACSGFFQVQSAQVSLYIQQKVTSERDLFACQYTFEGPEGSRLLVFANDTRNVDDGEIPGCPIQIHDGADQTTHLASLCGHYEAQAILVSGPTAIVTYKPEFNGIPYTVTVDLRVSFSGGHATASCGDTELSVVPAVPVRYQVVFKNDDNYDGGQESCDIQISSSDKNESLGVSCTLTSSGECDYEILKEDGSVLHDPTEVTQLDGGLTVRLRPGAEAGVLSLIMPGDFVPSDRLERSKLTNITDVLAMIPPSASSNVSANPNVTNSEQATNGTTYFDDSNTGEGHTDNVPDQFVCVCNADDDPIHDFLLSIITFWDEIFLCIKTVQYAMTLTFRPATWFWALII